MLKVYKIQFTLHHSGQEKRLWRGGNSRFQKNREATGQKKKILIVTREGQPPDEIFWKHHQKRAWKRRTTIDSIKLIEEKLSGEIR